MLSNIGNTLLFLNILLGISIIYFSFQNLKNNKVIISKNIYHICLFQSTFIIICFFTLVTAFVLSDFSIITVYQNSHSLKPFFYKISGTWGNHEGSLLLWVIILTIFSFLFLLYNKDHPKNYRIYSLIIQNVLILGFLFFLLFNSNPFSIVSPIPKEGLGLNPILQDPALAIHPPLLYIGYVGTSIIFSSSLAALICGMVDNNWANHIKKWIIASWIFLSIGIMLGSIWAYYELGWGGFWFWDPVENVSLMPWFCLTALIHTVIVLEKRNIFQSWSVILSITTFSLSMSGTFLVRSGILNSIHTFANDPSRGVFILCFLFFLIFMAIIIYFSYQKKITTNLKKPFLFSKETAVLLNSWFMMFFLSVVLIGTIYPIFLEVINGSKISIGPPFYQNLIVPFLVPFLFFMAIGPRMKWIKERLNKINKQEFFLLIISLIISYLVINYYGISYLFIIPLFGLSFFLFFYTIKDFFNKNSTLSQKLSHFGFSLLILSILFNGILSKEFSSNMKIGDEREFMNKIIKFENLNISEESNYKSIQGQFSIIDDKKNLNLFPQIRIYNQPKTLTSEADIISTIYSDNFLVFNILKDDGYYNVRYQIKPFMLWIWISVILISLGGILSYFKKHG